MEASGLRQRRVGLAALTKCAHCFEWAAQKRAAASKLPNPRTCSTPSVVTRSGAWPTTARAPRKKRWVALRSHVSRNV